MMGFPLLVGLLRKPMRASSCQIPPLLVKSPQIGDVYEERS
jgi:hypothetical protein